MNVITIINTGHRYTGYPTLPFDSHALLFYQRKLAFDTPKTLIFSTFSTTTHDIEKVQNLTV